MSVFAIGRDFGLVDAFNTPPAFSKLAYLGDSDLQPPSVHNEPMIARLPVSAA